MKNKIFLIVLILIGFVSAIYPQQKFRSAIFLHRSVGGNIYGPNGSNTSVPEECIAYNIAHSYTGTDEVSMDEVLFPWNNSGNAWYEWRAVFDRTDPDDDIYQYIENYDIIIIKTCYTVGIPEYGSPSDTLNAEWQSYYNYQWHLRHIANIMGQHPDKFFVVWTPAMYTPANIGHEYVLGDQFAYWMKDTLQAGIDPLYGEFPPNVHIYDYFHDIDSSTYLPVSLAVSPTDNHVNAMGTELIAPLFVNDVFDAAIAYEGGLASFSLSEVNTLITYSLEQNYPNPFNPSTDINFTLTKSGNITLKVYDNLGSEVATLVDGFMNSGKHSVKFNAKDSTSGIYFYRLKADNFTSTRKMLLIK